MEFYRFILLLFSFYLKLLKLSVYIILQKKYIIVRIIKDGGQVSVKCSGNKDEREIEK